jgi:hypothetical protein
MMIQAWVLVGLLAAQAAPAMPVDHGGLIGRAASSSQDASPIIDIALRMIRATSGGSSIARSAARGGEAAFLYARLDTCGIGAASEDPMHGTSVSWRASGRVRSVERGIAVADVEWQRLDYRTDGVTAGPRVQTTLTLPLGERVAVDFVEVTGSVCRMDGLVFEIGVAPDHGRRLAMSSEGRSSEGGVRGGRGGGAGRRLTADEIDALAQRHRQAAEAARAAPVVTRPMPPREYDVDVWLVPEPTPSTSAKTQTLAHRLSRTIGGTGGRFDFPPIPITASGAASAVIDFSALVIPVSGEQLVVAITRHVTRADAASPSSSGWLKAVPPPGTADVLSFEIPAADVSESAGVRAPGVALRMKIAAR